MSTDYHIYCRSCASRHDFDQAQRGDLEMLRRIIAGAFWISQLDEYLVVEGRSDIRLTTDRGHVDVKWFREHGLHELAIIDEYGRIDGTCGERFACSQCTTVHYCGRDKGHEGGCRNSKD